MNCKFIKYNMISYLEGHLPAPEIRAFEDHLTKCNSCRQVFEEFSKTYNLLDAGQDVQPNPFFFSRLEQRIQDQKQNKAGFVPHVLINALRPVAVTLLILLSILSGVLIGSQFTNGALAGSSYDSEMEYYTEYVYFNNVDDEPIEYYLLNQSEE
ncbi:MAG: zf-HC2 domain-containing protein [Bacteroidota bacterium]|nr:zf-HC2 domain-containing protein [Bacteroidota bacterium]